MSDHPQFSVVIPTYNRGHLLTGAVNSVLAQSCRDFELLIIDDGSTDNTREIVAQIDDHRVRCIMRKNGGGSAARNTGIDAAKGKFIAFLDADDHFTPNHLANALPFLASAPNTCIFTRIIVNRGHGITFLKPPRAPRTNEHIADYLLRDRGFVQTSSLIVPTELARMVRYDEKLTLGDDTDFAIRLVHTGARLRMLDEPGAIWNDYWSPNRLSGKHDPDARLAWLDRIKGLLPRRAFLADQGWHVAKAYARQGRLLRALGYYLRALFAGCYRPKFALVVFLQIVLPTSTYRKLADNLARRGLTP